MNKTFVLGLVAFMGTSALADDGLTYDATAFSNLGGSTGIFAGGNSIPTTASPSASVTNVTTPVTASNSAPRSTSSEMPPLAPEIHGHDAQTDSAPSQEPIASGDIGALDDLSVKGFPVGKCLNKMEQLAEQYCNNLRAALAENIVDEGDGLGRQRRAVLDAMNGSRFYRVKMGIKGLGARLENQIAFLRPDLDVENYHFARCRMKVTDVLSRSSIDNSHTWAEQFCWSAFSKHPGANNLENELKDMYKTTAKAAKRLSHNKDALANVQSALDNVTSAAQDPDIRSMVDASNLATDYKRPTNVVGRDLKKAGYRLTHWGRAPASNESTDGRFGTAEVSSFEARMQKRAERLNSRRSSSISDQANALFGE